MRNQHTLFQKRSATAGAPSVLAALLFAGCTANPYFDPSKLHHTREGFRNRYPHAQRGSFWKWKLDQLRYGRAETKPGGSAIPLLRPDVGFLKSNRSVDTLTWIGHASFLLQLDGLNILTDPHLTERASPLSFAGPKRIVAPALHFADLPRIHVVVISHNHYDHMDEGTLVKLAAQSGGPPRYFVGLGLKRWLQARGIETGVELDWWESRVVEGLTIHFLPVQHWSTRALWDENRTLWGGWMIESSNVRFFHAGDTGYSRDFADIRERFGPIDLAAIPVGGYEPRWFMRINHVDPDEAVAIHKDLGAHFSVGMHWGTFDLTDEPLDEPPKRLREVLTRAGISTEHFFLMRHGETRLLKRDSGDPLPMRRADRGKADAVAAGNQLR